MSASDKGDKKNKKHQMQIEANESSPKRAKKY